MRPAPSSRFPTRLALAVVIGLSAHVLLSHTQFRAVGLCGRRKFQRRPDFRRAGEPHHPV
ncbi:hypothetical protein F2981_24195 (plasmid) [Sinorhizobium meliloti]|nr:hypothetical protein [Sinorhizobium meliloti]